MQVPRVEKIVVNVGVGEGGQDARALEHVVRDVTTITGQRPAITRAKKSIASFRLRDGMPIGVKATLRGERMYSFLDRLCNVTLPRLRDFRGVSPDSFDGRGNYTLGLREQLAWPEIDYDSVEQVRGMEISIVTSARTDEEGRKLLELVGMPLARR
jgi:large subunit ribosomal protein L5